MGKIALTLHGKIGYNEGMVGDSLNFLLRIALIASAGMFVCRLVKPRTQALRITRAALFAFILLIALAIIRVAGV